MTPSYLWRRAVRILPAYWVALTISTIWLGYSGVFSSHWWVYYGLLQTYSSAWILNGLPVAWSLGVEISFYLALPLIALLLVHRGLGTKNRHALRWEMGALGTIALLALAWRTGVGSDASSAHLRYNLFGCLTWFCVGMIFAAIQVTHPASLRRMRGLLSRPELCWPVSIALFALLPLGLLTRTGLPLYAQALLETVLYALAAGSLLAPAIFGDSRESVSRLMANRVMVFAGTISYGIYLWHWAFLSWLAPKDFLLSSPAPLLLLTALATVGTVAAGTASWHLVEKPLMRRARSVKALKHVHEGKIEVAEVR